MTLSIEAYHRHFRSDAGAFAAALAAGPLDSPVASCPGWDLNELGLHLGRVHAWAETAVRTADKAPGSIFSIGPTDGDTLAEWYQKRADQLIDALESNDPDSPTWHIFPVPQVSSVWHRRQAHETLIHRWDAQRAIGTPASLDPSLASDGIDEFFEVILPRLLQRAHDVALPSATLHVHCTDVEGEWYVWNNDGALGMTREHRKGDAAMRGRAEDLLLALWHRGDVSAISVAGDMTVAEAWLRLGSV